MTDDNEFKQDMTKALIGNRIQNMSELQLRIAEIEAMEVVQELQSGKKMLKKLDGEVRELALDGYQDNGAKHPHEAVSVQMRKSYDYNISDARQFAFEEDYLELLKIRATDMSRVIPVIAEHHPLSLEADCKKVDKAIKSMNELPDWVAEIKEPFVKVASDLSEFIAEGE